MFDFFVIEKNYYKGHNPCYFFSMFIRVFSWVLTSPFYIRKSDVPGLQDQLFQIHSQEELLVWYLKTRDQPKQEDIETFLHICLN